MQFALSGFPRRPAKIRSPLCINPCGITSNFLEEQLVGLSLLSDMEEMRKRIMTRYLGDSRKAIIVILRDAAAKLRERQTSAQ